MHEPTLFGEIPIACATWVFMSISVEFFHVVCPAIELLFFRVRARLDQWFSHEPIRDECIRTRVTFESYQRLHHSRKSNHSVVQLTWVWCFDQIGSDWDKDQLTFGSEVFLQMLIWWIVWGIMIKTIISVCGDWCLFKDELQIREDRQVPWGKIPHS